MAQDKQDEWRDEGFQYIELMSGSELSASPAGNDALMEWVSEAQMESIPVLDAHDFSSWGPFEIDFGTPSITHIGPDMTIRSIDEGIEDPSIFLDAP